MQYLCDLHDDGLPRPAALSVMVVDTGQTLNVCQECVPTWGLIVAGVTPDLVDQALEQLRQLEAGDKPDTDAATQADWQLQPAADELPTQNGAAPALSGPHTAEGQEARVAAELAARGDSPATSEAAGVTYAPDRNLSVQTD